MFRSGGFELPLGTPCRGTAGEETSQGRDAWFRLGPLAGFLAAGVSLRGRFQQAFESQFGEFFVLLAMPARAELTVCQAL